MVTRPVIASTANTILDNWRIVVADICGVKTVKSAIISCMGDCPFKVIDCIYNFRTSALFIQPYFGEGIEIIQISLHVFCRSDLRIATYKNMLTKH